MPTESIPVERVAVVIVNFNSDGYLDRCLQSLMHSDRQLEICVVDNCSTDQSMDSARALAPQMQQVGHRFHLVENSINTGFSSAVNTGVTATTADYLFILNPDCQVHRHTVSAMLTNFLALDDAGMAGALVFNEDGTEQAGCRRNEPTFLRSAVKALGLSKRFEGVDLLYQPLPQQATEVDAVSGSAMFFRRSGFDEIGGMDEGYFLHCEDLDICRRMRDAGHKVYFLPQVSLFHRQGASGGSTDKRIESLKHQGMMRYYLTHYGAGKPAAVLLVKLVVWSHLYFKRAIRGLRSIISGSDDRSGKTGMTKHAITPLPGPDSGPLQLVTGANSDVGDFYLSRMAQQKQPCVAIFRRRAGNQSDSAIHWLSMEYFDKAPQADLPGFNQWVNLAPIWTIDRFRNVISHSVIQRIVALSSTSVSVKQSSNDDKERAVVARLVDGEKILSTLATEQGASAIVLRPTLIYGGPRNQNVNLIRRVLKTLRFFPMVGQGNGNRQPVHAEDVAIACELALAAPVENRTYTIAGDEVLDYRSMVVRIAQSMGQAPRIISVPASLARWMLTALRVLPGFHDLSSSLVDRIGRDQVFDNDDARNEFDYNPRVFQP